MIADLRLQNFRSYTDDLFEFEPGVNIVVGPNASGKQTYSNRYWYSPAGVHTEQKTLSLFNLISRGRDSTLTYKPAMNGRLNSSKTRS